MWTKHVGKIFIVLQARRVRCLCPKCSQPIILDYSTFLDNPVDINCYLCHSSFFVLSISTKKTKLELHLNEAHSSGDGD